VRELVDTGAATAGEIVLLSRPGTDAGWYKDELRKAGLRRTCDRQGLLRAQ